MCSTSRSANFCHAAAALLGAERPRATGSSRRGRCRRNAGPSKRLFSLTEAGREQLSAFAAEPTRRPTAIRDEFLIKMQAMDGVDPDRVRELVEERRSWALGKSSPATSASVSAS